MLQIGNKFLCKKNYHELLYEKCQIVFILLQLNSCSFNLVNPGKNPGFIRFLPGPGLGKMAGAPVGLYPRVQSTTSNSLTVTSMQQSRMKSSGRAITVARESIFRSQDYL